MNTHHSLIYLLILLLTAGIITFSCKPKKTTVIPPATEVKHVDWSKNAVIYEVNVRQFSKEGTFKAVERELPRLKELGVDILWLMPVYPVGLVNRKVSQTQLIEEVKDPAERKKYLGSYYSTRDYLAVNPEFGTAGDFKSLVNRIHELGMHVILDIAINHTSWDNPWIKTHPDFYMRVPKDSTPWNKRWMKEHPDYYKRIRDLGMTYPIHPEEFDWWDVAELNFDNKDLRTELIKIFKFWITEYHIDGYRCDYAHGIPNDFWDSLRPEIDKLKPVFMLGECEKPELSRKAFDMTYGWKLHHILNDIAKGKKMAGEVFKYYHWVDTIYPRNSYLMQFTSNHDENSWNGTEYERMGDGAKAFAVLTYMIPGMPLIYNGQESAFNRRLKFFEKDSITWGDYPLKQFYQTLNSLKHTNKALWNGDDGGEIIPVETNRDSLVLAFVRQKEDQKIFVVMNLSGRGLEVKLKSPEMKGKYTELFSQLTKKLNEKEKMVLKPWEYLVYVKNE